MVHLCELIDHPKTLNSMSQVTWVGPVTQKRLLPVLYTFAELFISLFCLILIRIVQSDDSTNVHFTDEEGSVWEAPLNKAPDLMSFVARWKPMLPDSKVCMVFTPQRTEADRWLQGEPLGWSNWFRLLINFFNGHLEPWAGYKRHKGRQNPVPELQESARATDKRLGTIIDEYGDKKASSWPGGAGDCFPWPWGLNDR